MTEAPEFSADSLLRLSHHGVTFDLADGLGAVPFVHDIDYRGFVAFMRPSVFLELCPRLDDQTRSARMKDGVRSGMAIGMPYLRLAFDADEMQIHSHEGRNRAAAILELFGDAPMPVAILPTDMRARNLTRTISRGWPPAPERNLGSSTRTPISSQVRCSSA